MSSVSQKEVHGTTYSTLTSTTADPKTTSTNTANATPIPAVLSQQDSTTTISGANLLSPAFISSNTGFFPSAQPGVSQQNQEIPPVMSTHSSTSTPPVGFFISIAPSSLADVHWYGYINSGNSTTYPANTLGQQPIFPHNYNAFTTPYQRSRVNLNKRSLPTFSGLRRDWPEFKAVWKSMADSSMYNKTELAHELKFSVKGEAKQRIKSVFITKPEAYDTMWEKLESYYQDTSTSVQAALEEL